LLAAVHVFIFSATFPFFNVVDEQDHLDLVVRYSEGDIPRTLTPPAAGALPFIAIYGTPEYIHAPAALGGTIPPPPWKEPIDEVRAKLLAKEGAYESVFKNHEASQPPLYYTAAGAWWRVGKILGLDGGQLLYWLRFLNVLWVVALVWVGRRAARNIFPENPFIQVAVPAFIAVMPQTVFYSINNDVASPVMFGLAFIWLMKFLEAEIPARGVAAALGLALAGSFLTKISNLPLLVVSALFLGWKIVQLAREGKLRAALPAWGILAACALAPMVGWTAWCQRNFGDFTGSSLKIQFLGWTDKPLAEWFQHPLFTTGGLWFFVSKNIATFWQGEFLWQGKPLASLGVDLCYVLLTLVLLAAAGVAFVKRRATFSATQGTAVRFGFACAAAMFAFFAVLSVKYDFQDCFYPSRAQPYFTSGRLMLGMLVPILLLLALGLDRLLGKARLAVKFAVLTGLMLLMVGSEVAVDWKIFPNAYNWFHL
jgi:hypothetical protein